MDTYPRRQLSIVGKHHARGFTTIELLIATLIILVVAAMAIPGYSAMQRYLRIAGDIRALNATVSQAKMRAAQDFTHARVHADLSGNTFTLEVWDKAANSGQGCWKTDGDGANRCTVPGTSPVLQLSPGVTFGFGSAGPGASNPQATIAQAPACSTGVAGGAAASSVSGNTACIEFNSRGLPVNGNGLSNSNSPTGNDAFYITDSNSVYGVTVIISGLIQIWTATSTNGDSTTWQAR